MDLSVFLNSKFAVALSLAIPAVILVSKMPIKDTTEAFALLINAFKEKVIASSSND